MPAPNDAPYPTNYGQQISMAFDANGDPALAYLRVDPNDDGELSDTSLYFISWNRSHYRWNPPVKVATTKDTTSSSNVFNLSLAFDSSNGRFGVEFEVGGSAVEVALSSDGGVTLKPSTVASDTQNLFKNASLAMAGGNVYLAFYHDYDGIRYVTGKETDSPDQWASSLAPTLPKAPTVRPEGVHLALDGAGKPALVYWLDGDNYNVNLAFWRPGSPAAIKVTDSKNNQNDDPDVSLTFDGPKPRIALWLARDDQFVQNQHQIWVTGSNDGQTWSDPVPLPPDGGQSFGGRLAITIGSAGQAAVTAWINGGNSGGSICGQPKLIRSSDLVHWKTCAPGADATTGSDGLYPAILFAGNDKLYLAFQNPDPAFPPGMGVFLWREP